MQTNLLRTIIDKDYLTDIELQELFYTILHEEIDPIQIAGILTALAIRGETERELFFAAKAFRQLAIAIAYKNDCLLDIVGTGGDGAQLFNISTLTSFVVAAGGVKVAKHGNRSVSSKSGSADILETAGANLIVDLNKHQQRLDNIGITFLFAQQFHPAMLKVADIRKKLGIRTLFNLLGPLTNPLPITHHCIGVYSAKWLVPFAEALKRFGSRRAIILHSQDKLDEISINATSSITELKEQHIHTYEIAPEQFGIKRQSLQPLIVKDANESLKLFNRVLNNEPGPWLDIILLNGGVAFYAAEKAATIQDGIDYARSLLASGQAHACFQQFIKS